LTTPLEQTRRSASFGLHYPRPKSTWAMPPG
jgi:hypothetical protein